MEPLIFAIGDKKPVIHETAFIAPGAVVCGDVEVHENASVWYGCVLRGDTNKIVVGKGSNVQDGTVIHVDDPQWNGLPTLIGENALIGHKCMLHGATVKDGGFVGMCATMLDGSVVETGAMLAAGAFLSPQEDCTGWRNVGWHACEKISGPTRRRGQNGADRFRPLRRGSESPPRRPRRPVNV